MRVAFCAATARISVGTLAAAAVSRGGRFRGARCFQALPYAPLVMPEVITGLSLLLLFVAVDAGRGFRTAVSSRNTTLTMCFVTVVVQSRLNGLDRKPGRGGDGPRLRSGAGCRRDIAADAAVDRRGLDAGVHPVAGRSGHRQFIGPGSSTLPIRIYSEVRLGVKPEINAICTLVIAAVTLVTVAASPVSKPHQRAARLAVRAEACGRARCASGARFC